MIELVILVVTIKNSNGPILVLNTQLCKMLAYNRIGLVFGILPTMTHTEVGFRKNPTNAISQGSFVIATSSCLLKDITVGLFMLLPYPCTLYLPYTSYTHFAARILNAFACPTHNPIQTHLHSVTFII